MANIKKSLGYVVFATILVYAFTAKIPGICVGCEEETSWMRCIAGTGKGSQMCEAFKAAESRVEFAGDIGAKAQEFMANTWDFTKEKLPQVIAEFIPKIKELLLTLKDRMAEQLAKIIAFLKEKIGMFLSKAKDIATSAYDRYLRDVIDKMTAFVSNNLITPIYTIIRKIIEFRDLVWEKLREVVQKFADLNIGEFVGRVVDVFKKIPEAISGLKVKIVDMVNGVGRDMVDKLNAGVNKGAEGIEKVVAKTSEMTDKIVDGSEGMVNKIVKKINDSMNKVESGIKSAIQPIETGVNKVVPIVNKVRKGIHQARDLNIRGIGKPLKFLPRLSEMKKVKIKSVNIPDIRKVRFPDVDFSVDIPEVKIPYIPEINPDSIRFPEIPGMGFITEKIASVKEKIVDIFEKAMDPLYTAVAFVATLAGTVVSSIRTFYEEYLAWDKIKERAGMIAGRVKDGLKTAMRFLVDDVLPAYIKLLKQFWTMVFRFVKQAAELAWKFVKKVGSLLKPMFNQAYKAVVKVTGEVAKGALGTAFYVLATTVDKYTPFLPVSLSLKMVTIVAVTVWMFFGQFFKNASNLFGLVYGALHAGMTVVSDADGLVDAAVVSAIPSWKGFVQSQAGPAGLA